MKAFRSVLFVVICLSLSLVGCTPAQSVAQRVVELPSPIQLAILSLSTLVVGFVFTKIAGALPLLKDFLGQYVDEVSIAVAGGVVLAIQNALGAVPPEWESVANAALALVVAILAAYGVLAGARRAAYNIKVKRLMQIR